MWVRKKSRAALTALMECIALSVASAGVAQDRVCTARIDRSNVVPCALAASLALRAERQQTEVLEGQARGARVLLPANPVLALSGAQRRGPEAGATNWYATLSQELEIAGQRGARRRVVTSEQSAQAQVVRATERDVAADALTSYFETLAARSALQLAARLEQSFAGVAAAAQAAATNGLGSGLDADLAEANLLRLSQERITAGYREQSAVAALHTLLGLEPVAAVAVDGELAPLVQAEGLARELAEVISPAGASAPGVSIISLARASARLDRERERPEVRAAEAQQAAAEQRVDIFRRARVPNLTVSAIAQRDGFDERVLGGGLSMPIPLPQPLGRTYAGEIAANAALARRAATELTRVQRAVRLEVASALYAFEAARAARALYSDERVARAQQSLNEIADQIRAGRLAVASAMLTQQALIDLLRGQVTAQLELCLRSVELARAAGLALEGGAP